MYGMFAAAFTFLCTLSLVFDYSYTKEDVCNHSNNTLEKVSSCPRKDATIKESSERKACHFRPYCQGKPLVYHCTRYKQWLVEVCAPRVTITGQCCTYYEEGLGGVVEDNTKNCSKCPFKYASNESLKFPECVKPIPKKLSNKTSKRNTFESTERNSILTASESPFTKQQSKKSGLFISYAVLTGLVLIIRCTCCICKKMEQIRRRETNEDHDFTLLTD